MYLLLLLTFPILFTSKVADSGGFDFDKHSQSYVIEKLKSYDIVFLGTRHKKEAILKFVAGLIPRLHQTGTSHLGLEICSDQQDKIDSFLQTGDGLSDIDLHPQIDCDGYRNLFMTVRSLNHSKRPTVAALDLPKSMYQGKINRDEWMARAIAKIFHRNRNAKVFVVVGNLHILKEVKWKEEVLSSDGFIRSYLNVLTPHRRMFSIAQLIDESPNDCDFTSAFSHVEGAVAMDCDGTFIGWKIGILAPVATKPTQVCEMLDGVIVY